MGIALGLTAAIVWGIADFRARFATRRIGTYRTLLYMQLVGFLFLSIPIEILGGIHKFTAGTTTRGWEWVILAGLINTGSTLALYRSFEIGTLAVVAPIAASYPALTVVLSILSGETIHRTRARGLVAAVIGLASTGCATTDEPTAPPACHSCSRS